MNKLWSILFGVMMAAAFALFPISYYKGWWLPEDVSTYGHRIDWLFYLILYITGFFFVLTEALLVWFMYRYSGGPGQAPAGHGENMSHEAERKLELAWSIVPGIILFLLAVVQISAWADIKYQTNMPGPDEKAQQLEVTAQQWQWNIRYPSPQRLAEWEKDAAQARQFLGRREPDDVRVVNEVHIWKGSMEHPAKVVVHLNTQDVLHSFFLPHVRVKQDALPGKTIPVWFAVTKSNCVHTVYDPAESDPKERWKLASTLDAAKLKELADPSYHRWEDGYNAATKERNQPGQIWELACAEYCGSRHSMMRGKLYVHETKEDFLAWLSMAAAEGQRTQPPPAR